MPRPISADRLCFPRTLMACHACCHPSDCYPRATWACNAQLHPTFVLSKPIMACHSKFCPFVCVVKEQWWRSTPNIIGICVMCKGYIGMPRLKSSDSVCYQRAMMACHDRRRLVVCEVQGYQGIPRPTSSDLVYCPKAMNSFFRLLHSYGYFFRYSS